MHSDLFLMHHIERISSSQLLGFKDRVFESSHGQSPATLVSHCPSRSSELEEKAITKHSDQMTVIHWTRMLIFAHVPSKFQEYRLMEGAKIMNHVILLFDLHLLSSSSRASEGRHPRMCCLAFSDIRKGISRNLMFRRMDGALDEALFSVESNFTWLSYFEQRLRDWRPPTAEAFYPTWAKCHVMILWFQGMNHSFKLDFPSASPSTLCNVPTVGRFPAAFYGLPCRFVRAWLHWPPSLPSPQSAIHMDLILYRVEQKKPC